MACCQMGVGLWEGGLGRARTGLALLLLLVQGCSGGPAPRPTRPLGPAARIVLLADLDGTVEPCGCRSRPLGGLDRIATAVRNLSRDGPPTVVVAVGDTFFADPVPARDSLPQKRIEARALARALGIMRVEAITPGRGDLGDGVAGLRGAIEGANVRLVASNLHPRELFEDARVVQVGDMRIGLVGVAHFSHRDGAGPVEGMVYGDPVPPAKQAVRRMREGGVDLVVALSSMGRRASRGLVRRVPGIDVVVVGDADALPAPDPEFLAGTTLVSAGHKGQGIAAIDLYPAGDDRSWIDGSAGPAVERRVRRIDRRIADLGLRLAGASGPAKRDLQARLSSLRRQRERATGGGEPEGESYLTVRSIEVGPDLQRDAEIRGILEDATMQVAEENARALADERAPPVPPGSAGYAGAASCAPCHAPADRYWKTTPHARAFETLAVEHKERHLDCVSCHVTGYRRPGGSTAVRNETLRDVQCESCHGASSLHVASEGRERPFATARDAPAEVCIGCHNPEHSDRFEYGPYRARILGAGHGMPESSTAPAAAAAADAVEGEASWYGRRFHGKRTASGERFDMNALTAAHRTFAFGTRVRVTDQGTGRSVVVRINDRGPFGERGRIIDLSAGAARALGIARRGVAQVRIEVLASPQGGASR